jgi:hypothetical protein
MSPPRTDARPGDIPVAAPIPTSARPSSCRWAPDGGPSTVSGTDSEDNGSKDAASVQSVEPKGSGNNSLSSPAPASETTPLLPAPATAKPTPYLGGISPARFRLLFLQLMAAYFVACFDTTIMASSHPVITSYFGRSNSASWLSTAFLLTATSFQPVVGGLSDAVGRKAPYLATTGVFLVGTVWCAVAGSMEAFVLARAVCGLGAGGMFALSSIILSDVVPIE